MDADFAEVYSRAELDTMVSALTATGNYRVLRKLAPRRVINEPDGSDMRIGLFIDTETTGLDPDLHEIIELAMVPFTYGAGGQIFEVLEPFQGFNQPSQPIPAEITRITGITDDMVAGHKLDPAAIETFAGAAAVVIAHHAEFDRPFLEGLCPAAFSAKPWACSMSEVDWRAEGHEGRNLAYLAMGAGFFYDKHRATSDCYAAIEVLATTLPRAGVVALARLLETARRPSCRIWATNSPFPAKDALKARGYRWNPDPSPGSPKAWYRDVIEPDFAPEIAWLASDIYKHPVDDLPVVPITAVNRFSARAGLIPQQVAA